jgi:hypothetical protein
MKALSISLSAVMSPQSFSRIKVSGEYLTFRIVLPL